jgi:hypothetical protein
MDLEQIINRLDGLTSQEVVNRAKELGHELTRQTVDNIRSGSVTQPRLPTYLALVAVAQKRRRRANA